ncbi:hypothetical protein HMPREF1548_02018 [Clostridium sp. KLE 1755]|nr:hypothetical protein HMPREF1548_02018 [Clostridium sp. KLE 1755]
MIARIINTSDNSSKSLIIHSLFRIIFLKTGFYVIRGSQRMLASFSLRKRATAYRVG